MLGLDRIILIAAFNALAVCLAGLDVCWQVQLSSLSTPCRQFSLTSSDVLIPSEKDLGSCGLWFCISWLWLWDCEMRAFRRQRAGQGLESSWRMMVMMVMMMMMMMMMMIMMIHRRRVYANSSAKSPWSHRGKATCSHCKSCAMVWWATDWNTLPAWRPKFSAPLCNMPKPRPAVQLRAKKQLYSWWLDIVLHQYIRWSGYRQWRKQLLRFCWLDIEMTELDGTSKSFGWLHEPSSDDWVQHQSAKTLLSETRKDSKKFSKTRHLRQELTD